MIETTTGRVTELSDEVLARIKRIQQNADRLKAIGFDKMKPKEQRRFLKTGNVKIGRNDSCPCGATHTGADGEIQRNKFKNCCLHKKRTKPSELLTLNV